MARTVQERKLRMVGGSNEKHTDGLSLGGTKSFVVKGHPVSGPLELAW